MFFDYHSKSYRKTLKVAIVVTKDSTVALSFNDSKRHQKPAARGTFAKEDGDAVEAIELDLQPQGQRWVCPRVCF